MSKQNKCTFGDGVTVSLDGIHEVDPCSFVLEETLRNVTIEILRCRNCGRISIAWKRQDNTEVVDDSE